MCVLCFTPNKRSIRRITVGVALTGGLLFGRSLFAQEAPNAPAPQPATEAQTSRGETFAGLNYLNGYSFLKGPLAPFKTREVPAPNLSNSPRMDQLVRDGKVYLSMSDAVAMALENNLDLAIARYNLPIADTDINYAGEAPSLISGVIQVNAKIPAGVGPGPVAVVIKVGGVSSQANVTVSVR